MKAKKYNCNRCALSTYFGAAAMKQEMRTSTVAAKGINSLFARIRTSTSYRHRLHVSVYSHAYINLYASMQILNKSSVK